MPYYPGKAIWLANYAGPVTSPTGGYRNLAGALYDPATVTLRYQMPGAPAVNVTPPTLVKDGVGLYHAIVTPAASGDAIYTFSSSDGAFAVATLKIEPAPL